VASRQEQAELVDLSAENHVEVQAHAVNGKTVSEVLTIMLLNCIKVKRPANRIVALDFSQGAVVMQLAGGKVGAIDCNTAILTIEG